MKRLLIVVSSVLVLASCKGNANNVVLSSLDRSAKIQLLCADLELITGNLFDLRQVLPAEVCVTETVFAPEVEAQFLGAVTQTQTGEVAVNKTYDALKCYKGPYKGEAPDLIVGYNEGYRVSWEAAIGDITAAVFHDNTKAWSGDHCIDPRIVPGVLFCNRDIGDANPRLIDLGPTTLDLFGVDPPRFMDGKPLAVADYGVRFNGEAKVPARREPTAGEG